jgi:hypothetical protein
VTVDGRKPSAGTTVDTSELDPANFVIVRLSNSGAEITGQVTDRGRVLGGDFGRRRLLDRREPVVRGAPRAPALRCRIRRGASR